MSDEFRAKPPAPLPGRTAASPPQPRADVRHLLIIDRRETELYRQLRAALAADSKTIVLLDRRSVDSGAPAGVAERRRPTLVRRHLEFHLLESVRVDIVRDETQPPPRSEDNVNHGELTVGNDRERVEQWVQDSQYVIGRLIPGLLEDRDRWRMKADASDQENERLRYEIDMMRKEIAERESERQQMTSEQAAIAASFNRVMEHLTQIQQPLSDAAHRLRTLQPAVAETNTV